MSCRCSHFARSSEIYEEPFSDSSRGRWRTLTLSSPAASSATSSVAVTSSAFIVQVVPTVEGGTRNADLFQGTPYRQGGLLDQPNDLKLLSGGVPHVASSPSAVTLFLSSRFSSVSSATTSFSAPASRRRSLTSSDVAARAVSPARRFLPASRNSFDQR